MFVIIGFLIVFGSVLGGFAMHHGNLGVLVQVSEFIIIGGAALGSLVVGNPIAVVKGIFVGVLGLLRPSAFNRQAYAELLQVLYQTFQLARKEGMMALESHVEAPEQSAIFSAYPEFLRHGQAVALLADTMKVLLTGTIEDHHLAEILDTDLDRQHEEAMAVPLAVNSVADAMPGFGIVAAVLGVIITMGSIGGAASEIGEKVAAALVGTFLGVLLAYGVLAPLSTALETRVRAEHAYMSVIRTAVLSFARGDSPMTCVEFARRSIEPADRPSFSELESLTRKKAA